MVLSTREFNNIVTRDAKTVGLFQYEVVDSLPTATSELEWGILGLRKTPGSADSELYVCLGDDANPTVYSWIKWANGNDALTVHTHADANEGGTVDHGALDGLSDDDHPQYATDTALTTHAGLGDVHHSEAHALDGAVHTSSLPFTDVSGTISDAQHSTVGAANAHAHDELSGLADDDHTQYLNVARHDADDHSSLSVGPTLVPKTADETIDTSTTFQNDNNLVFTGAINTIYVVHGVILYNSGSTPDIKFSWTVPAGASWNFQGAGSSTSGAPAVKAAWHDGAVTATAGGTASADEIFTFSGVVTIAGTGGSVQFQWAQAVSDAGDTTVKDGSSITYEAVS